ncbi:MAG: hypothetical protein KGH71_05820 [Candidatus Micrarchaeota archaeon]|nr:hypothetical protein [Candidatus Micrarchaeota archaeon]
MTGITGYFNPKAEAMKEGAQRYLGAESEILVARTGSKILALSAMSGLTHQRGLEIKELVERTLQSNKQKFMEVFSTLLYTEYGDNPNAQIKKVAGEAVVKYVQLLRDHESKTQRAENGLQISGASRQLGIDVGILADEMMSELRQLNRK